MTIGGVVDKKICLHKNCDGVVINTFKNLEKGNESHWEWTCQKCGWVFESQYNQKLKDYKIENKVDFIKWSLYETKTFVSSIIALILVSWLFSSNLVDVGVTLLLISLAIVIFSFKDQYRKKDYLESRGIDIYA